MDKSNGLHERLERQLEEWALPKSFVADIMNHLTVVTYEKGAVIFLRGSSADFLFCLLNGFAKLYLPHSNGNRTLVALARPGDLMGFINSLDSQNHRGQILEAQASSRSERPTWHPAFAGTHARGPGRDDRQLTPDGNQVDL
jgi:CRP-like cAMP-binding protein